jgi:hypothetical protein
MGVSDKDINLTQFPKVINEMGAKVILTEYFITLE